MLVQIITENGVKKIIPLTADAGAGNPVGTIIPMYKKSSPSGYLYCDGSTFDETKYPLLYAYLGSNVLPDYREFALVGAEENTTDVYNASTNPNGTIHDHDVYTEGQAKDDQVQNINGSVVVLGYATQATENGALKTASASQGTIAGSGNNIYIDKYTLTLNASKSARAGTVTRGKRKAVYFYIKATSGLSENAQDNVLNGIKDYVDNKMGLISRSIGNLYNFEDYYKATQRTDYAGLIVFMRIFTTGSSGTYILNLCNNLTSHCIGGDDVANFTFDTNTCTLSIQIKNGFGTLTSQWVTILG